MPPTAPTPTKRDRFLSLGAVATLALVILFAYGGALRGPFVFDDASSISQNPTLRSLNPPWAPLFPPASKGLTVSGRPVLNMSFALNHALGGDAVLGYHVANVALHLGAAIVLFGLLRRLLEGPALGPRFGPRAGLVSLTASALWAAHPLMTEAVTYTVQRAESLMAFFYLLTLYAVARASVAGSSRGWRGLAWAACWLGMGTKEVMVSAPLMAFFMDRTFLAGSWAAAWRARKGLYAGLALSWAYLGLLVFGNGLNRGGSIGFGIGVGFWEHLLTQAPALATYARLLLWPSDLSINYEPGWVGFAQAALPFAGVVAAIAACLYGAVRKPTVAYAGLLAFALLAPTSLMPAPSQFTCEHRMYLPAAGLIALAVASTVRWFGVRVLLGWTFLVPVAVVATAGRNTDYRTEIGLWRDNVAKQPKDAISREMLAEAYDHAGDREAAIGERLKAVQLYHGEPAGLAITECSLAQDLSETGRKAEAFPHFERALQVRPDYAEARVFYGAALESAGQLPKALEVLTQAVRIEPSSEEALYDQGDVLADLNRHEEAVSAFRQAIRLRPDHYEAHFNLGNSLAALGRHPEAIAEFQAALKLRPEASHAHYNLAGSWIALGRLDQAIPELERAVRDEPTYYDARCNLAIALEQTGQPRAALVQYEAARALAPNSRELAEPIRRLRAALGVR